MALRIPYFPMDYLGFFNEKSYESSITYRRQSRDGPPWAMENVFEYLGLGLIFEVVDPDDRQIIASGLSS